MTYYVSEWATVTSTVAGESRSVFEVRAGTQANAEGRVWRLCADFRADIATTGGYGLVWTSGSLTTVPSGVWLIAAGLDSALSTTVRNRIASLLGVSSLPSGTTLRQAVRRLMTTDATGPTNGRWKALPNVGGTFSIILGDAVDSWPV